MILSFLRYAVLTVSLLCFAVHAQAQGRKAEMSKVIAVDVLPGWRDADGRHIAALRFRLAEGWKTYWRSAGSTGISPHMEWSRSDNIRAVDAKWPVPTVSGAAGSLSIGYAGDFVLPLEVSVRRPDRPARLRGRLDIGVCRDVCLPARLSVSGVLPAEAATADPAILAALSNQPTRLSLDVTCSVRPTPDGAALIGEMRLPSLGGSEAVVFELPDAGLWITDAVIRRDGDILTAKSEVMVGGGRPLSIDRGQVRITVIGGGQAIEVFGCSGK